MKKITLNGFTLIEITLVLMIVGLLLAGLLPIMSAQKESQYITEARKQLDDIKESLIGYAISNGRLPCPANGAGVSGDEVISGVPHTCTYTDGVLPWATLGVQETDAWGRRFTYRVVASFADGIDGAGATSASSVPCALPAPAGVSFQLCSSGNLNVLSTTLGGSSIATDIPAVIISHGKNGYGAHTKNGKIPGGSADEIENANTTTDPSITASKNFVAHDSSTTFDDLVVWLSPNVLFNRMVTAGKLP